MDIRPNPEVEKRFITSIDDDVDAKIIAGALARVSWANYVPYWLYDSELVRDILIADYPQDFDMSRRQLIKIHRNVTRELPSKTGSIYQRRQQVVRRIGRVLDGRS